MNWFINSKMKEFFIY